MQRDPLPWPHARGRPVPSPRGSVGLLRSPRPGAAPRARAPRRQGAYSLAEGAVTGANVEGGGGLAANTRYFVYLTVTGGVLVRTITTTAPDANLVFQAGGTTHRYLGTFCTDDTGAIIPFEATKGSYRYLHSKGGVTTCALPNTAGVFNSKNLKHADNAGHVDLIPPTARRVLLGLRVVHDDIEADQPHAVRLKTDAGDTPYRAIGFGEFPIAPGASTRHPTHVVEHFLNATRQLVYATEATATNTPTYEADVLGFAEGW